MGTALGPGEVGDADFEALAARFDVDGCLTELAYLDEDDLPVPPSLPTCAMQIARRRHLHLLREDLGRVATGVETDVNEGARRNGAGPRFQAAYRRALEEACGDSSMIPAETLFGLFAGSEIGGEAIIDDAGSDLYARIVSQTAAVSAAALDSKTAGLGPARLVTRPLRGLLLILYSLVAGATRLGNAARAAVALALASGGALLAVALLQDDVPQFVAALGAALVLGGIAMTALRSRAWQFALVLGVPVLTVLSFVLATSARDQLAEHSGALWTIGALTVSAYLIGSLRQPDHPPWPWRTLPMLDLLILLIASLAAVLMVFKFGMPRLGAPGIVRLEFAGSLDSAANILEQLGDVSTVRSNILWDFPFLLAYSVALMTWNVLALRRVEMLTQSSWRELLTFAAWTAPVAGVLDIVENLALLRMTSAFEQHGHDLHTALHSAVPAVAWGAAYAKFVLIGVLIVLPIVAFFAGGPDTPDGG